MTHAARTLRVVSYNVHACVGTDGRFAPDRIAAVLATLDADFIALQEVEDLLYEGRPVSAWLAAELGREAIAGPTLKRGDADYGNVLLTRFPPARVETHALAYRDREPRGAIEADFDVDGARVRLVATHFGLTGRERRLQLGRLWPVLENRAPDVTVLCADLNEWWPFARVHRALREVMGRAPAPNTFPSRLPLIGLDRVYARPNAALASVAAHVTAVTRVASDHLPVVAEIRLPHTP
ncbi:MAG: endonuclease/exonuclease/phosphatase family protein [Woeseiaceae bacterium]|nr:endonuclease/exonuclease/phosphatase family protein [Woeseiaceae bacterium]